MFRIHGKERESYKQFGKIEEPATKKLKLDEANSELEEDSNIIYVTTQSM